MIRFVLLATLAMAGVAHAQEDLMKMTKILHEQSAPMRICLRKEVGKATSNEEASAIAERSCADVQASLKLQMLDTVMSMSPPQVSKDAEYLVDGAIRMARMHAYFNYTGELKRLQDDARKRALEKQTAPR